MTNILALPLVKITVETGNNEDWVDTLKFVVDAESGPQLDLTGIEFEMEVRRRSDQHEVLVTATSQNGMVRQGLPPDVGFMIINVPLDCMKLLRASDYIADIRAMGDGYTRVCVLIDPLTIIEGVSKSP